MGEHRLMFFGLATKKQWDLDFWESVEVINLNFINQTFRATQKTAGNVWILFEISLSLIYTAVSF